MSGELAPGAKLRPHTVLALDFGVAPLTVRQVLGRLQEEGLVSRQQGRGTFVRAPRAEFQQDPALLPVATDREAADDGRASRPATRDDTFRALYELAVATSGVLDPEALGRLVVDRACRLLGAVSAGLHWWDPETGVLRSLSDSDDRFATPDPGVRPGQGAVGTAFQRCEPVVVDDYASWEHASARGVQFGIRSVAAVPLIVSDRPLGALAVRTYRRRSFRPEHVQILVLLAAQVAPALEAARLFAQSERRRAETEALAEMARQGATDRDTEHVIALISRQACRLLSADYAAVMLQEADGSRRWHGMWGQRSDAWRKPRRTRGRGPAAQALALGRTIVVERLGENPAFPLALAGAHRHERGRTVLATPLFSREGTQGALAVGWRADVAVTGAQVQLAEAMAGYAGTIIDNARAHAREQQLAREAAARAAALAASEALLAGQKRVLELIAQGGALSEVLDVLAHTIEEQSDGMLCSILCLDPDGVHLRHGAASSLPESYNRTIDGLAIGPTATSSGAAAYRKATVVVHDIAADPLWADYRDQALQHGLRACWATPILSTGGQVLGAFALYYDEPRGPSGHDLQLIDIATRIAGIAIERKQAVETLEHQALHDALTGLPNRVLLYDRLHQAILSAQRDQKPLALLVMDLDHFKDVNDSLGHHAGDALLQQVGQRIRAALRASDTVARLGGDEFAVLLPTAGEEGAILAATKLLRGLEEPCLVDGHLLELAASIGIALLPDHGQDGETLLRRADMAMYVAKRTGRGYALSTLEQDEHEPSPLALAGELRQAIERSELVLHYQPKVAFRTGLVTGVEALVRWQHPRHGLLQPDSFIPQAEQTGLIEPLTRWVLAEGLRQCQAWRATGLELTVAINLSARNLHDPRLPEIVADLLATANVPPARLRLEITESAIMVNPVRAMEILSRLCAMGVRLAIDDFGTGYSSLAYLKRLPVHQLKIDRSFVHDMAADANDLAIVRATIELGHTLGLQLVAEGVEEQTTWELLAGLGCDSAQGYYVSRPLPADELQAWLRASPWGLAERPGCGVPLASSNIRTAVDV